MIHLPKAKPAALVIAALLIALPEVANAQTSSSTASPRQRQLMVGDMAPVFTLPYFDGEQMHEVSLREYRGKKNVVVVFYVFAFTGGCEEQLRSFQGNLERFARADAQVLGVSLDSPFANRAFAKAVNITFPLLSDSYKGSVARKYGVFYAKYRVARRKVFLIDKTGRIVQIVSAGQAMDSNKVANKCESLSGNGRPARPEDISESLEPRRR